MWPVKVLYITLHRSWPSGNSVFNCIHWFYPETDSLLWILMFAVFTLSCSQSRMNASWSHHSNEPLDINDTLPDVRTYTSSLIVLFPSLYSSSEAQHFIKGHGKVSVIPVEHIFINYPAIKPKRISIHVSSKFLLHITFVCVCVCVWWALISPLTHTFHFHSLLLSFQFYLILDSNQTAFEYSGTKIKLIIHAVEW
jgi:hypothetical protein